MLTFVVPYRNRPAHLGPFIEAITTHVSTRHRILVVEQSDELPFNRGALLNIGFLLSEADSDWVCFHDVDMIPDGDSCEYDYPVIPTHLAVHVQQYGFKLPYPTYCGGVFAIIGRHFRQVNGFGNAYWGWGREDDDFFIRLLLEGIPVRRRPGRYRSLPHPRPSEGAGLIANTGRLLSTVLFAERRLTGNPYRALGPARQICNRSGGGPGTPVDPRLEGLSTLAYDVVARERIAFAGIRGGTCESIEKAGVSLARMRSSDSATCVAFG